LLSSGSRLVVKLRYIASRHLQLGRHVADTLPIKRGKVVEKKALMELVELVLAKWTDVRH
jgi:hypothetical protein